MPESAADQKEGPGHVAAARGDEHDPENCIPASADPQEPARDRRPRRGAAPRDPVGDVLARLPGHRRSGAGWMARCPAHEDRNPSLSIFRGEDGRALLHCHAGCKTKDIVAALGLKMSDLFTPKNNGRARTIVAEYDYLDEGINILFQTVRY